MTTQPLSALRMLFSRHTKRREFITLLGSAAAAWPVVARAQQTERVRRIGVLMSVAAGDPEGQARLVAFVQGLQEQGWTVGRNAYAEIWLEKDALAGVILPVTSMYDVPLMVARGYASLSFLHSAAEYINTLDVPSYIYHLGDFDPSGVNAGEKIEDTLREMASDAEIIFERLAVTPEQIVEWNLPSRPTKASDTRAAKFDSDISVELDAIEPNQLRALVQEAIERHLPPVQFEILKAAEESEREIITRLVGKKIAQKRPR